MCSSSALGAQLIKFQTKWKGKRNPQTCYWSRASQTAQSEGCLVVFFSTLAFKKCLAPYCSFLLPKRPYPRKVLMCRFVMFPSEFSRGLSRFWLHESPTRFNIYYLKVSMFIKEMVSVQCATIELFYNNCLISCALIGSFLSSIRLQTDKILIYASFQQFNFSCLTVNFLTNSPFPHPPQYTLFAPQILHKHCLQFLLEWL